MAMDVAVCCPHGESGSRDATARLWDAATGQEKFALKGHTGPVGSVCFSPDGKHVLTGLGRLEVRQVTSFRLDTTARLWEAATGQEEGVFRSRGVVLSVCFSPDGKHVLTGCAGTTAELWDVEPGQEKAVLKGAMRPVAFSPDGKRILTGSGDGTARLWDVATGQEKAVLRGLTDVAHSAIFSPDGKRVS
jgi:WD40 repeat protein